jgi:hypothetical protein
MFIPSTSVDETAGATYPSLPVNSSLASGGQECCTLFGIPIPSISKISSFLIPPPTSLPTPHAPSPAEGVGGSRRSKAFSTQSTYSVASYLPEGLQSVFASVSPGLFGFETVPSTDSNAPSNYGSAKYNLAPGNHGNDDAMSTVSTTSTSQYARPNQLFPREVVHACRSKADLTKLAGSSGGVVSLFKTSS